MYLSSYSVKEKEPTPKGAVMHQFRTLLNSNGLLLCWAVLSTFLLVYSRLSSPVSVDSYPVSNLRQPKCPYVWHGGSPSHNGSCWCGWDGYCMCTPSLAIDAIMEVEDGANDISIVLVRRKDAPRDKHAIVGGFVEVGETMEEAVRREVKEETNLDVTDIELFTIYSDPHRDARRHTVSAVYRGIVKSTTEMKVGDDAKGVEIIKLKDAVTLLDLAFDHKAILTDFIARYHPEISE